MLLAIFAHYYRAEKQVKRDKVHSLMSKLKNEFDDSLLKKFMDHAKKCYSENGRLPSSKELSRALRPIRTVIANTLDQSEINQFMNLVANGGAHE